MTEPGSTGIGGDMFCLFYDAKTRKVHALNGSGRAPGNATCEKVREALGIKEGEKGTIPMTSAHGVTVPGAAAGWVDVVEKFGSGKLSMEQILTPAIELGEDGFPVSEIMGYYVSTRLYFCFISRCFNFTYASYLVADPLHSGPSRRACSAMPHPTSPR